MADQSRSHVRSLVLNGTDNTSPASNTYKVGTAVTGFSQFKALTFVADTLGGTGGALDVIIEHSPDAVDWYEFVHFTQTAAATAKTYTYSPALNGAVASIGKNNMAGSTLGTTMTLPAGTDAGGPWFDQMRVRYVAGASTSAGATQNVRVICMLEASA